MSEEKTVAATKENRENKKKKRDRKSIAWIIGVVVLILISLTFVLPTTMFAGSNGAVSFGSYNGKKIELSADSFFYYQLQAIYSYYVQNYGEQAAANYSYNIYYSAFQQAVLNEAFQEMAKKAGFKATKRQISDAVVASNYYSDGTKGFSEEIYDAASDMQKEQIIGWMTKYVPFNEVQQTILSVPVSSAESAFVSSLSGNTRTIEYIAAGGSLYPDESAVSYAKEREDLFRTISFTCATFATEEEAENALNAVKGGTESMEDAVKSSLDSSSANGGKTENCYRFQMDRNLSETDSEKVQELYSAGKGDIVGPVSTQGGYAIYRIDSASSSPDFTSREVLDTVKTYISENDSEVMKGYLDSVIDSVYAEAVKDFDGAAEKYALSVESVNDVALNTGDSQYIYSYNFTAENSGFTGNSRNGYIYSQAQNDREWNEELFSSAYNTVLSPVYVDDAYVIARPVESAGNSGSYFTSLLGNMYSSYAPQHSLVDCETKIISSDKVEDNFIEGYLQAAFGYSAN